MNLLIAGVATRRQRKGAQKTVKTLHAFVLTAEGTRCGKCWPCRIGLLSQMACERPGPREMVSPLCRQSEEEPLAGFADYLIDDEAHALTDVHCGMCRKALARMGAR